MAPQLLPAPLGRAAAVDALCDPLGDLSAFEREPTRVIRALDAPHVVSARALAPVLELAPEQAAGVSLPAPERALLELEASDRDRGLLARLEPVLGQLAQPAPVLLVRRSPAHAPAIARQRRLQAEQLPGQGVADVRGGAQGLRDGLARAGAGAEEGEQRVGVSGGDALALSELEVTHESSDLRLALSCQRVPGSSSSGDLRKFHSLLLALAGPAARCKNRLVPKPPDEEAPSPSEQRPDVSDESLELPAFKVPRREPQPKPQPRPEDLDEAARQLHSRRLAKIEPPKGPPIRPVRGPKVPAREALDQAARELSSQRLPQLDEDEGTAPAAKRKVKKKKAPPRTEDLDEAARELRSQRLPRQSD